MYCIVSASNSAESGCVVFNFLYMQLLKKICNAFGFFMFTIIEFNRYCGEMSTYIVLDYCFNYVILVIGIAHYVVI